MSYFEYLYRLFTPNFTDGYQNPYTDQEGYESCGDGNHGGSNETAYHIGNVEDPESYFCKDFKEIIYEDIPRTVIVVFQAPWCGHCHELGKIGGVYSQLVEHYQNDDSVSIVNVDCQEHKDLVQNCNFVEGYPTISKYINGKYKNSYSGERTVGGIKKYIEE